MRTLAILAFLVLIAAARPAVAEPPTTGDTPQKAGGPAAHKKKKAPTDDKAAAGPAAAAPAAADAEEVDQPAPALGGLAGMAAKAAAGTDRPGAGSAPTQPRRLDLTPQRQLDSIAAANRASDRRGGERRSGLTLGDDSSWKVQALQVGTMAALFGTLVAVCGNGRCLLPSFFGGGREDLNPDNVQVREPPRLRDPH